MIVDCHVHIRNADPDHWAELLEGADRASVDRLCISSLSRQWTEFPDARQLEEAAEDVLAACVRHPDRFIGGTYVSADHARTSMALLDRCIAEGPCRFVKLWVSQYADDPRLDPLFERCIELDAPILVHTWIKATGNMARESTAHNVVATAWRYPRLKLWAAHASGRWEEAARIVRETPNVALDVSGGEPEDGIVECLRKHLGPERIFWGSDAPGRSFVVQLSKVLAARLPEEEERLILGGNILRWLHV